MAAVRASPRVLDDLREASEHVSRKRAARLMKERGLVGEMPKRWVDLVEDALDHLLRRSLRSPLVSEEAYVRPAWAMTSSLNSTP